VPVHDPLDPAEQLWCARAARQKRDHYSILLSHVYEILLVVL
jgi:hypothetical protein